MPSKRLLFHDQARMKLCAGLDILADAVKVTLGPRGRTVVLESASGAPTIINSGVIVAREIELEDQFENVGAGMVREVASRTSELAGDGTTTATVLAQAIVRQGMRFVAAGHDPMDLKRGIDAAVDAVVARLRENSRKIDSNREIAQVGAISANNDSAIGAMIADALQRVGLDGVVKTEPGRGVNNELEIVDGLQFDRGTLSAYFLADAEKGRLALEDALLLLSREPIASIVELRPLLELVIQSGQPLLIVAEDVGGEALATLVINALRGTLKTCAVKTPGFGDDRTAQLEDIAAVTGARVVSEETGLALEKVQLSDLGRARRIEIDRDSTTIIGGMGERSRIDARIAQIRQALAAAEGKHERARFEERAARLAGGVALLKVGAPTETEMKEKRSRVEDALHATRAAMEEGIGPGGGVALLRARAALEGVAAPNLAQASGINIVRRALEEPLRQIVSNAGAEPDVIVDVVASGSGNVGYDAAGERYGDMMEMGIIDPTKVTRLALTNAASIAGLILTTDCIVTHPREPAMAVPANFTM